MNSLQQKEPGCNVRIDRKIRSIAQEVKEMKANVTIINGWKININ